jgi:transcriptional regulator with XRE-family HTH domain
VVGCRLEIKLVPERDAFLEYRDEDLPGVSLLDSRTKEGMTQTRLAELTGIPQRHLSMMEHGKRPIGKKNALLQGKVLKVDHRVFLEPKFRDRPTGQGRRT